MEKHHQIFSDNLRARARETIGQLALGTIDWNLYIGVKSVTEPVRGSEDVLKEADSLHDQGLFDKAHYLLGQANEDSFVTDMDRRY